MQGRGRLVKHRLMVVASATVGKLPYLIRIPVMPESQPNRRDFLQGRAAADAVSHWLAGPPSDAPGQRATLLVQFSRNAMATEFQVILNAHEHSTGPEGAMEALDVIEELEDQLSVYRSHSEISAINRLAAQEDVEVEWGLWELLNTGVRLSRETSGAFDMTAGPLSRVWGFHERRGRWPEEQALEEALSQVGSDAIQLDSQKRTVHFASDREINLGAIGKGWALDRAAEVMDLASVDDFLIHGGKSSVLARGSRHSRSGWQIGLMHPLIPKQRIGEVTIRDRAVGTSGCGNQFFHHQGRRLSHILDPRTGRPAEGVLSATVLAPTATEADALATALFVMGVSEAEQYLLQRPDLGALFVIPGARAGAVEIITINVPSDTWKSD